MSHYIDYYQKQAASGQTFANTRQTGRGFGSFISGLLPFVKKAGKTLYKQGVGIGSDILEGENVLETFKRRGITAAEDIAKDACDELEKRRSQRGSGMGRHRLVSRTRVIRKTVKRLPKCRTRKCLKRRSKTLSSSLLKLLSSRQLRPKRSPQRRRRLK